MAKDQNLPVVWLPECTSLTEALQRGSSLAGWAGLARKADGRLGVRSHAPRDSQNLIEARRALLPTSSPSLGVAGKDSYLPRGLPECDLAVLGAKFATWSTGWPVVVVRGLKGAFREGEVTVVADVPPPRVDTSHQWQLHRHRARGNRCHSYTRSLDPQRETVCTAGEVDATRVQRTARRAWERTKRWPVL